MDDTGYTVTLTEEDIQHLFDSFVARKKELFLASEKAAKEGKAALAEELDDIYQEVEELHDRVFTLLR